MTTQHSIARFARAVQPLRVLTEHAGLATFVFGLFITTTLFVTIRAHEQRRSQAEFARHAATRIAVIREGMTGAVEVLTTVNQLFTAMQPVGRAQFAKFTRYLLSDKPQLSFIGYQRIVTAAERREFEAERRRKIPDFEIRSLSAGGLVTAPWRASYRVVDFKESRDGRGGVLGFDVGTRSEQVEAVRRACETGRPSMTSQFGLATGNRLRPGFVLTKPVYRVGMPPGAAALNCSRAAGYTTVGVFSATLFGRILDSSRLLADPSFEMRIYQDSRGNPDKLVFHQESARSAASNSVGGGLSGQAYRVDASFIMAAQPWQIVIAAPKEPLLPGGLGSLLTLLVGGLGSALAAAYLGAHAARARGIRRLVKERTGALHQANRSLQLLRQAVNACPNSIVIIGTAETDHAIEYVNPAFEKMTGYTGTEVVGHKIALCFGSDQDQPGVREFAAMVREQREGTAVMRTFRKDGSMFWSEVFIAPVRDIAGVVTHFVAASSDVTDKRRYESELEYQATHDVLTGLLNPKLLRERLRLEISGAARHGQSVWVLFVDLDRFKFINDSVGHRAGDECLQSVARRLAATVRPEDMVARLGGDEFLLVLAERGEGKLSCAVLDRIMQAIALPVVIEKQDFFLSCSLGVATYPYDSDDPDTLIEFADMAMYRAKQHGRANYQFYLPGMNEQAQERLQLESALRAALERSEFELYYQPQLDLCSGRIVGVEALLRWQHPELGLLSPRRFLALAEETGLIVPIGDWTMHRACTQVRYWQLDGCAGLRLAVNIAARQFIDPELPSKVKQVLDDTGFPANCLELELTERFVMNDVASAAVTMEQLRAMGISIALDDFGTGYLSLAQLKNFPLDALKIDRSFVHAISSQDNDGAIPNAIISLAHNLGMRVVAEAVETEAQCEFLARNMCDEMQGSLFSPALKVSDVEALLAEGRVLPAHLLRLHKRERTLLLVDDEPNILSALKRQLRGAGLRILTAPSGKDGLALLAREPVDVIVSDQRMPGMTGVEFLRAVKNSHPDTVRIVLSGFTELQSVTDAVNEGAIYKFLTKPWDDTQLRNHIQEAMLHKEMADENRRLDLEVRTANHCLAQANRQLEAVLCQQQELIDRTGISLSIVREALHHVPLPILGLDEEQLVAFANVAAQELLGRDGMLLGSSAQLFMPRLLAALDQAGDGHGCTEQLHGERFEIVVHGMGNGTRSRGRLIIFKPAPAVTIDREAA